MKKLNYMLKREDRYHFAIKAFDTVKLTVELETAGWQLESLISFM